MCVCAVQSKSVAVRGLNEHRQKHPQQAEERLVTLVNCNQIIETESIYFVPLTLTLGFWVENGKARFSPSIGMYARVCVLVGRLDRF